MKIAETALILALAALVGALRVCLFSRLFTPRFGLLTYPAGCVPAVFFVVLHFLCPERSLGYGVLCLFAVGLFALLYIDSRMGGGRTSATVMTAYFSYLLLELLLWFILLRFLWQPLHHSCIAMTLIWSAAAVLPLAFCLPFARQVESLTRRLSVQTARKALVVPVLSVTLFILLDSLGLLTGIDLEQPATACALVLAGASVLQIAVIFVSQAHEAHAQRLAFVRQQLALQREHHRSLYGHLRDLETMRRQSRELIDMVSLMIEKGEYDEALAVIEEVSSGLDLSNAMLVCKNRMVNALLSHKISEAARFGITCDFEVALSENPGIDDVSLCSVFGNIMDNAIRACASLDKAVSRVITLKCAERMGYLIIKQENPVPEGVTLQSGGRLPATTKADKSRHGIGCHVLRRAAEQYDGDVNYRISNGMFSVTVTLRIHKGKG